MVSDDTIVTVADARAVGVFCPTGKAWCKAHGIPWLDVVQNKVTLGQLRQIDDAYARMVVEYVESKDDGQ